MLSDIPENTYLYVLIQEQISKMIADDKTVCLYNE